MALATGNTFAMSATIPPTTLLTRPQAASERFSEQLDLPCLISPLMETVWRKPASVPEWDALVFTSETGVSGWTRLHDWRGPAYCVGDRTAAAASAAGFHAQSAGGDAQDLLAMLKTVPLATRLLHVRGRHVATDMGSHMTPYIVYEQTSKPFGDAALALLSRPAPVIVPLFSPRSVALFVQALPADFEAKLTFVAISPPVADAIAAAHLGIATVALAPNAQEMVRVIRSLAQSGSSA